MQEGANPLLEPIVPQRALPRTHGDHSGPRARPRGLFHGAFPFFPFLSLFSYLPITCGNGKFIRGVFDRTGAFGDANGIEISRCSSPSATGRHSSTRRPVASRATSRSGGPTKATRPAPASPVSTADLAGAEKSQSAPAGCHSNRTDRRREHHGRREAQQPY